MPLFTCLPSLLQNSVLESEKLHSQYVSKHKPEKLSIEPAFSPHFLQALRSLISLPIQLGEYE